MRAKIDIKLRVVRSILLLCVLFANFVLSSEQALAGAYFIGESVNVALKEYIHPVEGTSIQIAPMIKQGERTPGTYTDVQGGIFDAIFKRAGIEPCKSDPAELRGHEGFLEHVKKGNSQVLNPGGTRATFGYFIKATTYDFPRDLPPIKDAEFFALFSYDRITKKGEDGKDEIICATELFLFRDCATTFARIDEERRFHDVGKTNLYQGLAVGSDGTVLGEVPLDLAQVSNFPGEEKRKGEPVRIDTHVEGRGCMVCHTANMDSFPQSTTPFPWTPWFDSSLVGTWECTSFEEPNNKYFTGGGTGFRVTFSCEGNETVDYSSMEPTKAGPHDTIAFTGKASAKISTDKGVAKIEGTQNAYLGVDMTLKSTGRVWTMKYPGLGPGGLGTAKDKNNYKCTEDSLEYETSYQRGQYTCTVKLKKVKPEDGKK